MPGPRHNKVRAAVFCRVEHDADRNNEGAKIAPNGKPYDLKIRASTNKIARDGGIIEAGAWENDLSRYDSNPVIMFAHDYSHPPVGNAVQTVVDHSDGSLVQYVRWLDGLTNDHWDQLAHRLRRLYEVGGMRAWSVGFDVHEWREPNEDERAMASEQGIDVYWVATRAELLETSAVPVPADPYANTVDKALRSAHKKGILDVTPLTRAWETAKRIAQVGYHCDYCGIDIEPAKVEWVQPPGDDDVRIACPGCAATRATTVQTLVFPKNKWDSLEDCRKWLSDHDFKTGVDETDSSWRFRQRNPGDFAEGGMDNGQTFATICILPNDVAASADTCRIKAVVGVLKKEHAGDVLRYTTSSGSNIITIMGNDYTTSDSTTTNNAFRFDTTPTFRIAVRGDDGQIEYEIEANEWVYDPNQQRLTLPGSVLRAELESLLAIREADEELEAEGGETEDADTTEPDVSDDVDTEEEAEIETIKAEAADESEATDEETEEVEDGTDEEQTVVATADEAADEAAAGAAEGDDAGGADEGENLVKLVLTIPDGVDAEDVDAEELLAEAITEAINAKIQTMVASK